MKYILVTGCVNSGNFKDAIASSIGKILKRNGCVVTAIKIHPYINTGEVFVDDGSTMDFDLGNYESINTTNGKIYQYVISKERQGKFLGKTVQVVPHITDAIQDWVRKVAVEPIINDGTEPEICIIELSFKIGDIGGMPFVEAFQQFHTRVKKEDFCCVHVNSAPQAESTGEHIIDSVMELSGLGLSPDLIVCRSKMQINESVKSEISKFCDVAPEQVIYLQSIKSMNHVIKFMEEQGLVEFFCNHLNLTMKCGAPPHFRRRSWKWRSFMKKINHGKKAMISLVSKSTGIAVFYPHVSAPEAPQHSGLLCDLKLNLKKPTMKYILVTGGCISGIGKGVVTSSIGNILKSNGCVVTAIKIDPYINIDAGTFSPYEHGEVFVLDDGGEVDLDLGNYERFMNIKLCRDNNITTSKIYQEVFNKEKQGCFSKKNLKVVPHITDAVQDWVQRAALKPVSDDGIEPEICIIELGGTIGDIESMPFVKAFQLFQYQVKKENFCCVHVSLVPQPKSTGEDKTKPTQASVSQLRRLGLRADLIVCRSDMPVKGNIKSKISYFCEVPPEQVICLHDVKSVYHVPMLMEEQGVVEFFHDRLNLPLKHGDASNYSRCSQEWRSFVKKIDHVVKEVRISLVGKYTVLEDAYTSVTKALQDAALMYNLKLNLKFIAAADLEPCTQEQDTIRFQEAWKHLCESDGIIVPGGFGASGVEGKIAAIEWARKNKKPFLGICLGFQLAVVEFARNVLGWKDAHSFEMSQDETKKNIVIEMPEHHTGTMGGTMRLGKKRTMFKTQDSISWQLYDRKDIIEERHRHRYEVDKTYVPDLEAAGLRFVAEDETGERLEILELPVSDHPYFVAVQFHPEYISRPLKPSPPYLGLILSSIGKLNSYLTKGFPSPNLSLDSAHGERIVDTQTEPCFSKN